MFKQKKTLFLILSLIVCLTSCQHKKWTLVNYSSTRIPIDNSTDVIANKEYIAFLEPLRNQMDEEMNVVIGYSLQTMKVTRPESLLSNFCSDACRVEASLYLNKEVDLAIVNMGGLRTEIPEGDITIRKMFELMPFENEMVILWLKGDKLAALCDVIASIGGEGVSGIKFGIKDGRAVNPLVGGLPLDREKVYTIATNDYLAGGNDRLVQLAEYEKMEYTGITMRDMLINYIKSETIKGNKIKSQLDGRIYEIK